MSDDEDYMSSAFLAKVEDVKPGVGTGREGRRILRINANREEATERHRAEKSKVELERDRLIEGLNNPIRAESKGFQLLAKMGYKEGMSLGRSAADEQQMDSRTKEPILIQLRMDRSGVGMDEHRKEKQRDLCEAYMERMKRQADNEEELAIDFRRRKRAAMEMKQLISEIQKLRKTCQEMDTRIGKTIPDQFWFWPIYSNTNQLVDMEVVDKSNQSVDENKRTKREPSEGEEGQVERYTYGNGEEAPMALNLNELDNQRLEESLTKINAYMRKVHFYCLYCGCAFTSSEEMDYECPGIIREDHE
ncbi:hypothetical protein niasHS_010890 [Heterodera schachtii]|uniref:G patch domain-containing protein 11 n=1 Tax=Heterodera schachtii TaxID=97005 RepID=A0ABD2J6F4_HETSC